MKPYFEDDSVVIYHADCRDVWPSLVGADHLITDPPYSEHIHKKQWIGAALTADGNHRVSTAFKELGFDALTPEIRAFICEQAHRSIARWSLAFCDLESIFEWKAAAIANGLDYVRACIWDKVDSAPQFTGDRPAPSAEAIICAHRKGRKVWNGGGARNIFRHAVNGKERGAKPHPSTKPLPLMTQIVSLFTNEHEVILDPFMGSGTTLRAAKDLGRRSIGIEIEERYCEIAAKRMSQSVMQFGSKENHAPNS